MTLEERVSISNGVWLCYTHGKLIDTDETRFTVPQLKRWRQIAEWRARLEHDLGHPIEDTATELGRDPLVEHVVQLTAPRRENVIIGDALRDSCVGLIWGQEVVDVVRDALVEIARNALSHGSAKACELRIDAHSIALLDDGRAFNAWHELRREKGGGGSQSVQHLLSNYGERLLFDSVRRDEKNVHLVAWATNIVDLKAFTPCVAKVYKNDEYDFVVELAAESACCTIYIDLGPAGYLVYSDLEDLAAAVQQLRDNLREADSRERGVVFVVRDMSAPVRAALKTHVPDCRIVLAQTID